LWCTCCYSSWGFSVLFPELKGKCHSITHKDGLRPALPKLVLNFLIVIYVPMIFIAIYILLSLFCVLCLNVYCNTATGCQPNCS
jgi:hypothetical protein